VLPDKIVNVLEYFPTRLGSRLWGNLAGIPLATFIREPIYKAYAYLFNCNLEEMESPLSSYNTLGEFFARRVRRDLRPQGVGMLSPVDGTVLHFGEVYGDKMEQIKGLKYSITEFLGPNTEVEGLIQDLLEEQQRLQKEGKKEYPTKALEEKRLYYCVLYLAPGDYHGVHSPVDWQITQTRHFPGHLFSVSKKAARLIKNLFVKNERVVLMGNWEHGFFSLSPVGAYNVGSIKVSFDEDLKTNHLLQTPGQQYMEKEYADLFALKGQELAFFHLGSSVVLLFESPEFAFAVRRGRKVKFGQTLGFVINPTLKKVIEERKRARIAIEQKQTEIQKLEEKYAAIRELISMEKFGFPAAALESFKQRHGIKDEDLDSY